MPLYAPSTFCFSSLVRFLCYFSGKKKGAAHSKWKEQWWMPLLSPFTFCFSVFWWVLLPPPLFSGEFTWCMCVCVSVPFLSPVYFLFFCFQMSLFCVCVRAPLLSPVPLFVAAFSGEFLLNISNMSYLSYSICLKLVVCLFCGEHALNVGVCGCAWGHAHMTDLSVCMYAWCVLVYVTCMCALFMRCIYGGHM